MVNQKRIYLIGFMGAGKTTLGKALAELSGYTFLDLDDLIENNTGKSIAQIFKLSGETAFRKIEEQILRNTKSFQNTVIATGGGTPCFSDNISWMNKNGTTIFLDYSYDTLVNRLVQQTDSRPLLQGKSREALSDYIRQQLEKRYPYYRQAQIILKEPQISASYINSLLHLDNKP